MIPRSVSKKEKGHRYTLSKNTDYSELGGEREHSTAFRFMAKKSLYFVLHILLMV